MLVLTRNVKQRICIGGDIVITVVEIKGEGCNANFIWIRQDR